MSTPSLRTVLIIAEKREVLAAIRTLLHCIPGTADYGPADVLTPAARYRLVAAADGVRMLVGIRADAAHLLGRIPLAMEDEAARRLVWCGNRPSWGIAPLLTELTDSAERDVDPWTKEWRSFEDDPTITWTRTEPTPGNLGPAVSMSGLEDAIRRARDALLKSRTPPIAPPRPPGAPNVTAEQARDALEECIRGGVWPVDWGGATPRLGRYGHQRFVEFVWANDEPETCPDIDAKTVEPRRAAFFGPLGDSFIDGGSFIGRTWTRRVVGIVDDLRVVKPAPSESRSAVAFAEVYADGRTLVMGWPSDPDAIADEVRNACPGAPVHRGLRTPQAAGRWDAACRRAYDEMRAGRLVVAEGSADLIRAIREWDGSRDSPHMPLIRAFLYAVTPRD